MTNTFFKLKSIIIFCVIGSILILSCGDRGEMRPINEISQFVDALPNEVIYPADNPYSLEKEELGRLLFWDPVLSGTQEVACATCHHPDKGYADGLTFSRGVGATGLGTNRIGGMQTTRNAHTVINTAFNGMNIQGQYNPVLAPMFWDNRATSLEEQAGLPLLSKEEMRGSDIAEEDLMPLILDRLNAIPDYQAKFNAAFGTSVITQDLLLKAIATFERSLIATNSPFDEYMRGDENALSRRELDGLNTFIAVGCADCHSGPMFSDYELHVVGVPDNITPVDRGATNDFDFRTPTLRNVALTAPYMHNGSLRTLEDVLDFYEDVSEGGRRGNNNINANLDQNDLDEEIRDLRLNGNQIDDIISFLETLNDRDFDKTIPSSLPSGLPVGGNIQ